MIVVSSVVAVAAYSSASYFRINAGSIAGEKSIDKRDSSLLESTDAKTPSVPSAIRCPFELSDLGGSKTSEIESVGLPLESREKITAECRWGINSASSSEGTGTHVVFPSSDTEPLILE